jgi:hypothetical protein
LIHGEALLGLIKMQSQEEQFTFLPYLFTRHCENVTARTMLLGRWFEWDHAQLAVSPVAVYQDGQN